MMSLTRCPVISSAVAICVRREFIQVEGHHLPGFLIEAAQCVQDCLGLDGQLHQAPAHVLEDREFRCLLRAAGECGDRVAAQVLPQSHRADPCPSDG